MATLSSSTLPTIPMYRAAAIQYEPTLGEKEKNIVHLLRLVEEAVAHGARLIVLPEMATTGYCWESREEIASYVEPIPGLTSNRFQCLAARYDCYIAFGLPEVDPRTNIYYNSMALVGPNGLVGVYRKIHSYIAEPRWARDGDVGIPVWETPLGRLSGLICVDAMYFETARIAALHHADVLLFPTNWVDDVCPSSWWMARAFENGVYVIAANRYGNEREVQFSGGSCILNPDGSIQAYLDGGEGIVYGEIDLTCSRDKQFGHDTTAIGDRLADRRPDTYSLLAQNTYLWEPLRYHSLYSRGELPPGQLSGTGIIQMRLQDFPARPQGETIQFVRDLIRTLINDAAPTQPDVLVLPELLLPGPLSVQQHESENVDMATIAHFQSRAIQVPGPETAMLVALADELQISIVLGVAEREKHPTENERYYNSVLLIDPGGVYGLYRKLHLTHRDRLWATPGNLGLPYFDTPAGRIGLATGYDVLFPETLRILAAKGVDLVCAPALLDFPDPIGLHASGQSAQTSPFTTLMNVDDETIHYILWRVRAAEHNVYLALANWSGMDKYSNVRANGMSGIFAPTSKPHALSEVIADEGELALTLMTIDTREQRTGRRTTQLLGYSPGDIAGSLTGELAYDIRDTIPGNVVRSKPMLRKRQPYWYLDLV